MDASHLNCPPLAPEDAQMIRSTRIRVGRNLADFPLGPGITNEQRDQVEQKIVEACSNFQGELAGKYYSLRTMTPEEQQPKRVIQPLNIILIQIIQYKIDMALRVIVIEMITVTQFE